jgi:hypothetical protein
MSCDDDGCDCDDEDDDKTLRVILARPPFNRCIVERFTV